MTPTEIITAAQNNLNALTDTLWGSGELLMNLYLAEMELTRKTQCIESTSTSLVSIASTADYTVPVNFFDIIRVTYNGTKLQSIDRREFDTINPSGVTTTGTPAYYILYDDVLTLFPTPDTSSLVIKIWYHLQPAVPTASTTLEVPSRYHDVLVAGVTYRMCPKDLGHPLTLFWRDMWMSGIEDVRTHVKQSKRSDRFSIVKVEEITLDTDFGII